MSTISQRASDVRSAPLMGLVGMLALMSTLDRTVSLVNKAPQAQQVGTVVVATATNSYLYEVTVNGVAVQYQADAATTKDEIANGLAAAINAEPLVRGQVSASSDGVDTVTLTGLLPGVAFTVSETDTGAKLTVSEAVTAADTADAVGFGLCVIKTGYTSGEAEGLGRCAVASAFTAQVDTLVVTYAAGETYIVRIDIDNESYSVQVAANTDSATTAGDMVTAINAIMPANTVLAANPSGSTVTLTCEVAGKEFKTGVGLKTGTIARLALTHTTPASVSTSLARAFAGVAMYAAEEEITTVGGTSASYPANAGMRVLQKGCIWVSNSQTPAQGDKVYVELAAGANAGKFYNSSSATRVLLPQCSWERASYPTSDNIAALNVAA